MVFSVDVGFCSVNFSSGVAIFGYYTFFMLSIHPYLTYIFQLLCGGFIQVVSQGSFHDDINQFFSLVDSKIIVSIRIMVIMEKP